MFILMESFKTFLRLGTCRLKNLGCNLTNCESLDLVYKIQKNND